MAQDHRLEVGSNGSLGNTVYETTGAKGSLAAETSIGLVEGQVYMNLLSADFGGGGTITPFRNRIFVANGSWLNRLSPDHTLRIAAEYRHNWIHLQEAGGQLTTDVFSLSGMWNWQVPVDLSATTALRLDHLELDRDAPTLRPRRRRSSSTMKWMSRA